MYGSLALVDFLGIGIVICRLLTVIIENRQVKH